MLGYFIFYSIITGGLKLFMKEEIEVKFLNIEPREIEKKLKKIGAKKIFDKFYRRRIFDYPDLRLHKKGAWIRIRDEGGKTTLTFKQRLGIKSHDGKINDEGMREIEIEVKGFGETANFLRSIGLKEKFYEENRRIRYKLGEIEFDIDFWPKLKPYLEIEAPSWEEIDKAIDLLEFDAKDKKIFSTYQIYQLAGINEEDYREITFQGLTKK
ncbi:MAG: adenylyl cyclase [Candidatus Nealsonbacteria bacterium CG02_land_8_20_14_3_00_37_10]|uniref:Adenylyl cyclase n=1 Tax=Candidatus Nealsonbacteria bacterium CG02_land_8_20_14_3_00_37_10 TaxID=1974699 RepID=A0A2M7DA98_9BACT|nr:MAG: adenylyl cyclase [Candidatus Nealsonbacteria bacterium CG02_land_8_20_14_3_00_37_10]